MFSSFQVLTKDKAFNILSCPLDKLNLSSDYYKAVTHLAEHPCKETESVLISLLKNRSSKQEIRIAQRKALEVLGRFGSQNAIPYIVSFLEDEDKYMTENAVWALKELKCDDPKVHNFIASKLDDCTQNRRVIIQALASFSYVKALPKIKYILDNSISSKSEYGAAIAAISKLTREKFRFKDLQELLHSENQNDRQTAIQDVIDAGAIDLLIPVIKTPVSPYFRLRAIDKLCTPLKNSNTNLISNIDTVIIDNPECLNLINIDNRTNDIEYLIKQLFHTDFNSSYSALRDILCLDPSDIWKNIYKYIPMFKKDYGALYFLLQLFNLAPNWPEKAIPHILKIASSSIDSSWPSFIKFRPVAILILMKYKPLEYNSYIIKYLDIKYNPYWVCRYSCLLGLDSYMPLLRKKKFLFYINKLREDSNRFVALKAKNFKI